jgi:hypothetical protein
MASTIFSSAKIADLAVAIASNVLVHNSYIS